MRVPTFNTLERLLKGVYGMIEEVSCVFIDEYYKWYELDVVVRTLGIENPEEINGLYLMDLNDQRFISEEGINHLLLYFDNLFKNDVGRLISNDVMLDVKDYSMYMSSQVKDQMLDLGLSISDMEGYDDDHTELIKDCSEKMIDYGTDSKRPLRRRKKVKWSEISN